MARPLNSTKPLYNSAQIIKAGRPSSAKLTIGYLGPNLNLATPDDINLALTVGQYLAEHKQILAAYTDIGTTTAAIRGVRDKAGTIIGFSAAKNYHQAATQEQLAGLDTVLYAGSTVSRQKLFIEAIDALIIQTYPGTHIQLSQSLTKTMPVGVLITSRETTQQVSHIVELVQATKSPIEYSDNPRQLLPLIIKQAKELRIQKNPN